MLDLIYYLSEFRIFEAVTFLMALIGFAGTVIHFFYSLFYFWKRISVEVIDYAKRDFPTVRLLIHVHNASSKPLCVSSIHLKCANGYTRCELLQKEIFQHDGIPCMTPEFPINFQPYTGLTFFLEFPNCSDISLQEGDSIKLLFQTHRGKIKKTISLSHISCYLHKIVS